MEKAIVYIAGIDTDINENGQPYSRFLYKAILETDGVPTAEYGCDIPINTTLSADANDLAMQQKVADDAASRGYKITLGDVILSGSFVAKNAASRADGSKGITSDKDATAIVEAPVEAKPVGLMASLRDRFTSMWG